MTQFGEVIKSSRTTAAFFAVIETNPVARAWTGFFPITVDGNEYKPVGVFGSFTAIRQTTRADAHSFNIGSMVQDFGSRHLYEGFIQAVLGDRIKFESNPKVTIYIGTFDRRTGKLVDGLRYWGGGLASHNDIDFAPGAVTSTTKVEPLFIKGLQARATHLTDEDQQRLSSGDLFLQYAAELNDGQKVTWDPVA